MTISFSFSFSASNNVSYTFHSINQKVLEKTLFSNAMYYWNTIEHNTYASSSLFHIMAIVSMHKCNSYGFCNFTIFTKPQVMGHLNFFKASISTGSAFLFRIPLKFAKLQCNLENMKWGYHKCNYSGSYNPYNLHKTSTMGLLNFRKASISTWNATITYKRN